MWSEGSEGRSYEKTTRSERFRMRYALSICLETFTPISTSLRGFNFAAKSLTNRSYTSTWYGWETGSSKNSTSFSVIWCHSLIAGENEICVSTRPDRGRKQIVAYFREYKLWKLSKYGWRSAGVADIAVERYWSTSSFGCFGFSTTIEEAIRTTG